MKKVNLLTKVITNEALPKFLKGLKQESLNDLSWTDKTLGIQDYGFWQEKDITEPLLDTEVYDGTVTYALDEVNCIVKVSRGIRAKTQEELEAEFKATVPQIVSKRQARLALLEQGLLSTVETAIQNGTDEVLKIEWEYADSVNRDWESLNTLTSSLDITEKQLDELFILASTK